MKKLILGVGILWILAAFFTSCCNPTSSVSLPVTLHPQQMSNWCWAASGQMVMEHLGKNVDQCTEANNEFGASNCCNSPFPGSCNSGGWPEFDKYGFSSTHTSNAPLSWDQIKSELFCAKRPFCFTWHWTGGGGHMMACIGYDSIDG
ncbi:MAG: papain-like cysteine protease family protein, partial [Bacteroidota bacterium]